MEKPNDKPQLFNANTAVQLAGDSGTVARATQEVQAALVIAKEFPRDETRAIAKITQACQRLGLAEAAEYEYSRGGTKITGPTIDLLKAIANRWGNLLYGWEETNRDGGQSRVRCYAWDTENNSRAERTFFVRHWRDTQGGGYALKDERDIYELISNQASRRVRACLEQVVDQDVVMTALDECRKTLRKGVGTQPLRDRAAAMVVAFAELGVTQQMVEKRLCHKLDAISENQLASLRRIYKAVKDGEANRDDFFKPDAIAPEMGNVPGGVGVPAQGESPGSPLERTARQPETTEGAPSGDKPEKTVKQAETPLAKLRELARKAKVKDKSILDWLAAEGATDGSVSSLEELVMQFPKAVAICVEQWESVLPNLQGK